MNTEIVIDGAGEVAYKVYFRLNVAAVSPDPMEADINAEIEVQRYWILSKIMILKSEYPPQVQVVPSWDFEALQTGIESHLKELNGVKIPRDKIPNHVFQAQMARWPTDEERKMLGL